MKLNHKETAYLFAAISTELKSREMLLAELEDEGTREHVQNQIKDLSELRHKVVGGYVYDR